MSTPDMPGHRDQIARELDQLAHACPRDPEHDRTWVLRPDDAMFVFDTVVAPRLAALQADHDRFRARAVDWERIAGDYLRDREREIGRRRDATMEAERLTRERDEARSEVERLRAALAEAHDLLGDRAGERHRFPYPGDADFTDPAADRAQEWREAAESTRRAEQEQR